jgi:hypothetical protein
VFEYSIRDFFEAQTEVGVEFVVVSSCWLGSLLCLSVQFVIFLRLKRLTVVVNLWRRCDLRRQSVWWSLKRIGWDSDFREV